MVTPYAVICGIISVTIGNQLIIKVYRNNKWDRLVIGKFRNYRHKIISNFPPQAASYLLLTRKNICDRYNENGSRIISLVMGYFLLLLEKWLLVGDGYLFDGYLFINYLESCENRYCSAFPQAM